MLIIGLARYNPVTGWRSDRGSRRQKTDTALLLDINIVVALLVGAVNAACSA